MEESAALRMVLNFLNTGAKSGGRVLPVPLVWLQEFGSKVVGEKRKQGNDVGW
jgi:hypothetical protein